MTRLIYNVFLHTMAAPLMAAYYLPLIALGGKYRRSLGGKLGRLPADFEPNRLRDRRIWFHAVSVGEVTALTPVVKAVKELIPDASVIVSTGTETGQDRARESIPEADAFLYLPLDFPAFVNRVVQRIRPDLFVLMETELWPNLIHSLKASGTRIALANGRISDRSFPRYKKLKSLFSETLQSIDVFLMSSDSDGQRIEQMGAPRERILVTGNTKFDAALETMPGKADTEVRRMFDLDDTTLVFVAGSTHPGEHEVVFDAYGALAAKYPELVLILVPRHVDKIPLIQSALRSRNMGPAFLRSAADSGEQRGDRKIILVDRMGELFRMYSVASVVFMGGSLVPRGGQNIVEPAAWGKIVLFGPSMEDFREAREILVGAGAGIEVTGADDLAARIDEIFEDPETYETLADKGRLEIISHVGSARKNAESLSRLL